VVGCGGALLTLVSATAFLIASHRHRQAAAQDAPPPPADTAAALARQARDILESNCARCHGEGSPGEGGFNYVLDFEKLVARKKVVSGDAEHSKLFRRVSQGEMPPPGEGGPLQADAVAVLKQWIDAGAAPADAPADRAGFASDAQLVALMDRDLHTLPERDRRFARYFTFAHLANAGRPADELRAGRDALSKLLNSLSWGRQVVPPRPVDPAGTVLRIDLRDYSWNERTWQRVLSAYPHGLLPDSPAARSLLDAAGGDLPYVRGDWFVAQAARPPLYHDLLGLPDNEPDLQKLLHIDGPEDVRLERVARAGFNGSGISHNNRLIERHASPYGSYWRSYDFADGLGRRNLFAHPLGPGAGNDTFTPDGGEIIFDLPNGLHAFMLVNGAGRRLDKAPLAIVSDPHRPDRAVENGVSCMSCHTGGLIPKDDQVRADIERNAGAFRPDEADAIQGLYPAADTLRDRFAKDNARYQKAVARTGAPATGADPVAAVVERYEKDLDLTAAAAELGLRPADLSARLNGSAALARTVGQLTVPGGTVQRSVFNDAFPGLVRELRLGTYLQPGGGRPQGPARH
jgi:mono/diheme cytochrome c family protein